MENWDQHAEEESYWDNMAKENLIYDNGLYSFNEYKILKRSSLSLLQIASLKKYLLSKYGKLELIEL